MDDVFLREPGLLDKVEACEALNISIASLNRAIANKEIAYFKLTPKGKVLFASQALRDFLKQRKFTPSPGVVTTREELRVSLEALSLVKKFEKVEDELKQLEAIKQHKNFKRLNEDKEFEILNMEYKLRDEKNTILVNIRALKERGTKLLQKRLSNAKKGKRKK